MTEHEYALTIFCHVFNVSDGGDAYINGIFSALSTLDVREQAALEGYYRYGHSYRQLGMSLGISGESARQVLSKAILKLRHPSKTRLMSVSAIIAYKDVSLHEAQGEIDKLRSRLGRSVQSVTELGLSRRTCNHLISAGFDTVDALLQLASFDVLMQRQGFGLKSRAEIIQKMRELGYARWADSAG